MKFFNLFCILMSTHLVAQEKNQTTDQFKVGGLVKQELVVSVANLEGFKLHSLDSVVISNHLMQRKCVMKNLKGVLLKDILDKAEILSQTPKDLSEYYIVCVASDNYKAVFSWNEIYNTAAGDSIMVLTAHDGKGASSSDDGLALLSFNDKATGRRYVKWLKEITVKRAQ